MTRIEEKFKELKLKNQSGLILYLTAGDPKLKITEQLILKLEQAGADIIELGVPFSDPTADGPTIQRASQRALKNYFSLDDILGMVERVRTRSQVPLLLFSYYNPIFKYGEERLVKRLKEVGIDGILVVDLPVEESENLAKLCKKIGINLILLATPTSNSSRLKAISKNSSGFIYYVSVTGITGARKELPKDISENLAKVKKITKLPIAVGFGVSTPGQAQALGKIADAVVVGSALVSIIEQYGGGQSLFEEVEKFCRAIKSGLTKSKS